MKSSNALHFQIKIIMNYHLNFNRMIRISHGLADLTTIYEISFEQCIFPGVRSFCHDKFFGDKNLKEELVA